VITHGARRLSRRWKRAHKKTRREGLAERLLEREEDLDSQIKDKNLKPDHSRARQLRRPATTTKGNAVVAAEGKVRMSRKDPRLTDRRKKRGSGLRKEERP